jgi:hypothetical protein
MLRGYIRNPCFCNSSGPNLSVALVIIYFELFASAAHTVGCRSSPTLRLHSQLRRYTHDPCLWDSLDQPCALLCAIYSLSNKDCWVNSLIFFSAARLVPLVMSTLLSLYLRIYAGVNTACHMSFSIHTLRPTAAVIAGFHE